MKFQKVRNTRVGIDYDWMMVIDSIDELTDFHQKSMSGKIGPVWSNLFDVQQGKRHIDNKLGFLITLKSDSERAQGREHSLIELTAMVLGEIHATKLKAILQFGKIYINKSGGFFPHSEDIEVLDEFTGDNYLFPNYTEKDIRVKQWLNGSHWYAYVGDLQVEMFGEKKWNTEEEALKAAKSYLYRLKSVQFEFKNK
jgi:hypothetical protein